MLRRHVSLLVIGLLALLAGGLAGGCEREDSISFYQAPKDPPSVDATVMQTAQAPQAAGEKTQLHWDAPKEWKEIPAGQMRVAAFRVNEDPPVDFTVIPLGAQSGSLLANVNRWEKEVGIGPTPQEKLAEVTQSFKIGDLEVTTVDLKGAEKRTLAAIVPHAGRVWFFKMQGPPDVVEKQKDHFDAFMKSLHAAEEGHTHGGPGDAHAGHDHAAHGDPHADPHGSPVSKLTKHDTPQGWRELPDSKPPRMLAFEIGSGEKKAEMVATRFGAGNAGSFADNINRWHTQLGLEPPADPKTVPMKDAVVGKDGEGIAIELHNPKSDQRMVVVIASARGDLWFFKFSGPGEIVTAERPKFDAFMKSLEFGGETQK